jgi:iron(III) transport system ATP-binding protein
MVLDTSARPALSTKLEGVTKRYGRKVALHNVSLSVNPGEFLVLLGPSGSGKTSLLRLVAGIEKVDAGTITIGDQLVAGPGHHVPADRRFLSMVFQDYALWPQMTVTANVAFAAKRLKLPRGESDARVEGALASVGIAHLAGRFPDQLSGGEQQRVALARSMVAGSGLWLLDEPLSNLDAGLRERLRLEIASLCRSHGATAIYITHDQQEAFALADRIGVMDGGKIIQLARPEDLYRNPTNPFVARFTGLAGELDCWLNEVELEASEGLGGSGLARVTVASMHSDASILARFQGPVPTGSRLRLMARPSAVVLMDPSDPRVHLRAEVIDSAFRGSQYDHALRLADGSLFQGVPSVERFHRGSHAGIWFDPEGCMLFSAEGDDR